jgi:hypothetical protein
MSATAAATAAHAAHQHHHHHHHHQKTERPVIHLCYLINEEWQDAYLKIFEDGQAVVNVWSCLDGTNGAGLDVAVDLFCAEFGYPVALVKQAYRELMK